MKATGLYLYRSLISLFSSRFPEQIKATRTRAVLCGALAFTSSGALATAHAQTAHFAGVETVVASTDLSNPHQVALDASGDVFIADVSNNRVLKETPTPSGYQESVVASTGLKTPGGVAVDANGNVYVADSGNNRILKEELSGGSYTEVVVPISGLNLPLSIAVDGSGNLYIADWGNARVVKEVLSGNNYSQGLVLGGPNPDGVAVDASGNVYVCAPTYNQVIKMTPNGAGYAPSYIGSGLFAPHGVAIDQLGVVYIAESGNSRIVKEIPSGSTYLQTTILSTGSVQPQAIASDTNGNLYFNDPTGGRVLKLALSSVNFGTSAVGVASPSSSILFSFDSSGSISLPSVVMQGSSGLDYTDAGTGSCTTNGTGHVYQVGDTCTVDVTFAPRYAGTRYGAALLADGSGSPIATAYLTGAGSGPQLEFVPGSQIALSLSNVPNPLATAVDGAGNLYVSQSTVQTFGSNSVYKETWDGGGYISTQIATGFDYPWALAVDGAGNVYVSDLSSYSVYKLTPSADGTYTKSFFAGEGANTGVAVDGAGNVYIGTGATGLEIFYAADGFSNAASQFVAANLYVSSLALDGAGNIYMTTSTVNGIVKESPSGSGYIQSTVVSGLDSPTHVAVDGLDNLYVTTGYGEGDGNVYKETLAGGSYTQSTLATALDDPSSISVDGSGNVYFASNIANSLNEINYMEAPVLHFAATAVGTTSSDSPQTVAIENSGNAAMNVPQPPQGYNPSIPSGFTVSDSATTACPLVDAGSPAPGTLAAGASCNLTVSFSPQLSTDTSGWLVYSYDAPNVTNPTYLTTSIPLIAAGAKLGSSMVWVSPSSITYGTPLDAQQLNARTNVLGSIVYSPAAGTVLAAGTHTLSAAFTPADSRDFTAATAHVQLTVNRATPAITWNAPAAITYGTALSSTQLNASTPVAGTIAYSPVSGTVLSAGSQTLTASFTPSDTADYTTASAQVTLTVNQATPTITWPTPAAITYGTALSATQLDATAPVPGTFSYSSPAGTILAAGTQGITATFTPTDATDYKTATATIYLTVNQVTTTITWATPAAITYGTQLSATQLDATGSGPGAFSYSPSLGSILAAGSHSITATFYPTDSTDYASATATVTLVVNQATPTIAWSNPAVISYGTALNSTQLNARATGSAFYASLAVAGNYIYSPAAGTVLGVGSQTLSVTFTPIDTTDYTSATASVMLTVNQATPAITWATPGAITYGVALSSVQLNATSAVPGIFAYSPAAGTVLSVGQQTLATTFTPTDAADYKTATATVMLGVSQATPTDTLATSASEAFASTPVTFTATVAYAVGTPIGTVTFYDGATTLGSAPLSGGTATFTTSSLAAGSHSITASYSGDATFMTAVSGVVTETIETLSIGSGAGGNTSATASPGGQAVFTLPFTPSGGSTFAAATQLSVSGLPTGATAAFSPNPIPAGAGATNVTLTVTLPARAAVTPSRGPFEKSSWPIALGMILLPFAGKLRRGARSCRTAGTRLLTLAVAAVLTAGLAMGLSGCGGSSSPPPSQTYSLTVTAASGSYSQNTTLTLTVE